MFNTTVSLHINMVDAYKQSPLWAEYVEKDLLARDATGQLLSLGIAMKGESRSVPGMPNLRMGD
jgi:hypothetical protein